MAQVAPTSLPMRQLMTRPRSDRTAPIPLAAKRAGTALAAPSTAGAPKQRWMRGCNRHASAPASDQTPVKQANPPRQSAQIPPTAPTSAPKGPRALTLSP